MSGVFWCCCVQAPWETVCPCNCVCDIPFAVTHPDTGVYIGVWRDEQLISGQEWTLIYWTNECSAQTEAGVGFHQYTDPEDPTTVRTFVYLNPDYPVQDPINSLVQEFSVEIRDDQGNVKVSNFTALVAYEGDIGACKMRVFRFRRIIDPTHGTGFLIPEMETSIYHEKGIIHGGSEINDVDPPDRDQGFFPQGVQKTYLGAEFPPGDVRYNPNIDHFGGCISNLQIYSAWLPNATLDALWANGEGLSPPEVIQLPDIEDQWCAKNPPWQEAVGQVAGQILKHEGAIWDQNGDHIEDGQNRIIHGLS